MHVAKTDNPTELAVTIERLARGSSGAEAAGY